MAISFCSSFIILNFYDLHITGIPIDKLSDEAIVIEIEKDVFKYVPIESPGVVIPDSVTDFGNMFDENSFIRYIKLGAGFEKFDPELFVGMTALEKITILNGYAKINDNESTIAPKASICGYDDSSAHVYAVKYERNFVSLGPIPPSYLGDVNKDETVDSTDASLILAEYALLSTNGTPTFDDDQNKK